jgi:single-strand DNA-binding protein
LKTRKYTDKDGVEKYATEIVATDMTMLGSREGMGDDGGGGGGSGYSRPAARQAAPAAAPKATAAKSSTGFGDMDDDIPF